MGPGPAQVDRDIDATVDSIAVHDPVDAQAYRRQIHLAVPLVQTVVAAPREGGSSVAGAVSRPSL